MEKIVFEGYALFLLAGAYFGWKAGSKISLIAGIVSGILVFLGIFLMSSNLHLGYTVVAAVSLLLTIVFLIRYLKTRAMMPSGMLLIVSVLVFIFSVCKFIQLPR